MGGVAYEDGMVACEDGRSWDQKEDGRKGGREEKLQKE
jgi:hypothetical protein